MLQRAIEISRKNSTQKRRYKYGACFILSMRHLQAQYININADQSVLIFVVKAT